MGSHFTFNTEITLISVYDSDGNNVTEKYNQKNETNFIEQKSQSHDIRLDALSTKMDKLMKEMNEMQSTLNDIKLQNGIFAKIHEEDVSNGSEWLRMDQKLIIIKFWHILFCFVLFFFFYF